MMDYRKGGGGAVTRHVAARVAFIFSAVISAYGTITIDRATTYQTIEGFGFFGGRGCWWDSSDPKYFYSDQWLDLMFNNLGATMWRNELYPHVPVTGNSGGQDATWDKQRPCAQAIDAYCKARGFDVKILLTVWSPPKGFKCKLDDENFLIGQEPSDTKGGNVLDPQEVGDFRDWLVSGLQMYKDAGLDVYAMSFQNEPYFWQSYNSCFYYQERSDRCDYKTSMKTLNAGIRNFTNSNGAPVKTFGSENMLEMEAAQKNIEWFYHTPIKKDSAALATLDRWAVHGYTDGINSQSPLSALDCWKRHDETFGRPTGKPTWQTEISGFAPNRWLDLSGADPVHGAFSLGLAIQVALRHGKVAAWVWWQGTDSKLGQYGLTAADFSKGLTFYASKQFYRFVRPGAVMVAAASSDAPLVVTAFEHSTLGNFVVVICNDSDNPVATSITGDAVPRTYAGFLSSAATGDTCRAIGEVLSSRVSMPGRGILTLVNGNFDETKGAVGAYERRDNGFSRVNLVHASSSRGHLKVTPSGPGPYSLEIFDVRGKTVEKLDDLKGMRVIELSRYPRGMYVANVKNRRGVTATRICPAN